MTVPADGSVLPSNFTVTALGAHHDGSAQYVPEGTPAQGDVVPVRVRGRVRAWASGGFPDNAVRLTR